MKKPQESLQASLNIALIITIVMALVALISFAFLHLATPMINEAFDSIAEKREQFSSYVKKEKAGLSEVLTGNLESFHASENLKSYKEAELSKERTDLRNFEYKILGATKAENKEHLLDLDYYVFLRGLDLEELNRDKIKSTKIYSTSRTEEINRFNEVYQNGINTPAAALEYGLTIKRQDAISYVDSESKDKKIKEMQANILKAASIKEALQERISMQEKYEELEEILSN